MLPVFGRVRITTRIISLLVVIRNHAVIPGFIPVQLAVSFDRGWPSVEFGIGTLQDAPFMAMLLRHTVRKVRQRQR